MVAQSPIQISSQRFVQVSSGDLVSSEGQAEGLDDSTGESRENEEMHLKNRQFWDRFIDSVEFNHSEQEKPRHGEKTG